MTSNIKIEPCELLKLKEFRENVYCSKITTNNVDLVIDINCFKLLNIDKYLILEFVDDNNSYEKIQKLENEILETLCNDSKEILGIKVSRSNVKNLFKQMINLPTSLNSKPYIQVKPSKNIIINDSNFDENVINKIKLDTASFLNNLVTNSNDLVDASIKFKKIIFCKDSIILDYSCTRLKFIAINAIEQEIYDLTSDEISNLANENSSCNDNINGDGNDDFDIHSLQSSYSNGFEAEDSEKKDYNIEEINSDIEEEIITSLDSDELLEANSMIPYFSINE